MLTVIESKLIDLKNHEIGINDFEKWVYSCDEIENLISVDDYIALISIDFRKKYSVNEVEKILYKYIDYSKYYKHKIIRMLKMIIEQDDKTGDILREFYYLYCHGCYFLNDLGLVYGLACEVPPSANTWDDLGKSRQRELVESFYPKIIEVAKQVMDWFQNDIVRIVEYNERDLKYHVIDTRVNRNR